MRAALVRLAAQLAPDRRLAVCDFRPLCNAERVILRGTISDPAFRARALDAAAAVAGVEEVDDWLLLLPTADLAAWAWFVPRVVAADLWRRPGAPAAERVDQALLGTPLRPLRTEGEWVQVQAPDGYLGWALRAELAPLDPAAARLWEQEPWVHLAAPAELRREVGAPVLAYAGTALPLLERRGEWLALRWPGSGAAVVPAADCRVLRDMPHPLRPGRDNGSGAAPMPSPAALAALATRLAGTPYAGGGATPAGFDAGGLIRYLFAYHGVALPRDPDQQWAASHPLGPEDDPLPADLLFFGAPGRTDPVAVALYLGDGRCVCVREGGVEVVSFHPGDPAFDPTLAAAALGYRRVLPPQGLWGEGI